MVQTKTQYEKKPAVGSHRLPVRYPRAPGARQRSLREALALRRYTLEETVFAVPFDASAVVWMGLFKQL